MTFIVSSLFIGCRPEKDVTDFNILGKVPVGEDAVLSAQEDTPINIRYSVLENQDSVNLELTILTSPEHGVLKDCKISAIEINCLYVPEENFNGLDSIEFITKDGELKAEKSSTLTIEVEPVGDNPIALDYSFQAASRVPLTFELPEALDIDSLGVELTYQIEGDPNNGVLTNCLNRICSYTSESLFQGVESIKYSVTDEEGLVSNQGTISIHVTPVITQGMEQFNQNVSELSGVDIIWVVDNSQSMAGEQQTLKDNFTAFIDNFLVAGKARFPFNMAITTTDAYRLPSGANPFAADSNGNTYDLSSVKAEADFASFKSDFEDAVSVGIAGHGSERSFESMQAAYNLNPSWVGDNSRMLVYIILSDEREQSFDKTIPEWASHFQGLKDKPEKVSFFPIIRLSRDNEDRYEDAAALFGTDLYDIDAPFQSVLDKIGLTVSNNLTGFKLRTDVNIIEESIKVSVGGNYLTVEEYSYSKGIINILIPPENYTSIVITYNHGVL